MDYRAHERLGEHDAQIKGLYTTVNKMLGDIKAMRKRLYEMGDALDLVWKGHPDYDDVGKWVREEKK